MKVTEHQTDTAVSFSDLAAEINREHKAAQDAARSALEHAIRAGELLIQAKEGIAHGEWGKWLQDNVEVSERTAQAYMRTAKHKGELVDPKTQRVADLPLREALAQLAEPKHSADEGDSDGARQVRESIAASIRNFLNTGKLVCAALQQYTLDELLPHMSLSERTLRELVAVVESERFENPLLHCMLPPDLSVLYRLARLDEPTWEYALDDDLIRPDLQPWEVHAIEKGYAFT